VALPRLEHVLTGEKVLAFQDLVRRVPVPDHLYEFAVDLARRTRPGSSESPGWLKPLVSWGAGPRAAQYLVLGAKARPRCSEVMSCGWKTLSRSPIRSSGIGS